MLALGHPTVGKHFAQVNVDLVLGSKASRDFMAASFIGSGRGLRAEEVN
jgi:hypothetical protein